MHFTLFIRESKSIFIFMSYRQNIFDKKRMFVLCATSVLIGFIAHLAGKILVMAIAFFTNLFWFQTLSTHRESLGLHQFSWPYIFVPVIGGLIIGFMARYINEGIRGHGLPEVMENILTKDSKIPRRMTILKPLASAISIGSGGPFGAEGPIIATGSSLGSFVGQYLYFRSYDRKILLAVGAAAGMTAVFGTPLAAVFICIELLLFEFSAKSFIPVLIGVSTAYSIRLASGHIEAEFPLGTTGPIVYGWNSFFYFVAGFLTGGMACLLTKTVFAIETFYKKLPVHWMWWPAIGGLVVGIGGFIDSRTLGVGYLNITEALQGKMLLMTALTLFALKFITWPFAIASETSGGTLAPLLIFGCSFGIIISHVGRYFFPEIGILPEVTALVCMSAMFSGATRAILTSTVFALEITGAHFDVAPLLLGNSAAYMCSLYFLKETIMTERIVRHGTSVPNEYFSVQNE